jgi:hypothetical protein
MNKTTFGDIVAIAGIAICGVLLFLSRWIEIVK